METIIIDLGTRKVQDNNGARFINIPNIAVRLHNIHAGDVMRWELVDGVMCVQKVKLDEE